MHMIWNRFSKPYYYRLILLLSTNLIASSCKNSAADRQTEAMNKIIKTDATLPTHCHQAAQSTAGNTTLLHNQSPAHPPDDANQTISPANTISIQPTFTLQDMTIQAGTQRPTILQINNYIEGYVVKTVSITKNTTTSYVKQFGLDQLKNQPINASGLTFMLTTNKHLKHGVYLLKLTIGKLGIGNKATRQSVACKITVFNNQTPKIDTTACMSTIPPTCHHTTPTTPIATIDSATQTNTVDLIAQSNESVQTQEETSRRNTENGPTNLRLKDMTIQPGSTASTTLEIENHTQGYRIKYISVTKNSTTSYVKKFGLTQLKNTPIPPHGLTFTLTADKKLRPDIYFLKITVSKTGIGSNATIQMATCTIRVVT